MRDLSRTALVFTAIATLALTGVAAPAHAAPKGNVPAASASAETPIDDSVTIDYGINRGAQAIASQACDIDGDAVPCDTSADTSTKKAATYSVYLSDLTDGEHAFTVTFTLTDGGSASAEVRFTIDAAPTLQEVCESFTGTLTQPAYEDGAYWKCIANPYTGPITDHFQLLVSGMNAMAPYCPSDMGWSHAGGEPANNAAWYCRLV